MIERILKSLRERRRNIIEGNVNCIPSPFERFRGDFPGIEQGKYYLVSANSKVGKTQLMNYLFLYNSVMYSYYHPDKVHIKILYYNLEETQEAITLRFMCYLLYTISGIHKSPGDLKSVREDKVIDEAILNLFEDEPYKSILDYFERTVAFLPDKNPFGIYKQAKLYAESNGVIHNKKMDIKDKSGNVVDSKDVFDYYVPHDPKEYVMIIVDHCSLISCDGKQDLREAINTLSSYMVQLRNRYNYIPVVIQQQNQETGNLEAFKLNKIRPTMTGLADSKFTSKDCNVMLGLCNPWAFEINSYGGYSLSELKGNARFLEVVINRDGESNGMIGLYFDGAVNYYEELPKPNSPELGRFITRKQGERSIVMTLFTKLKHLFKYDGITDREEESGELQS